MISFFSTLLFTLACQSEKQSPEDGWWANDDADPYTDDGGEGGEGEEGEWEGEEDNGEGDEAGFFGLLYESESGYIGESGVEKEGCMWYTSLTAESTEGCPACDFAVSIRYGEFEVSHDDDCPEGYSPQDFANTTPSIGFGSGSAWQLHGEEWIEFAAYFQEDIYHVWFVEF